MVPLWTSISQLFCVAVVLKFFKNALCCSVIKQFLIPQNKNTYHFTAKFCTSPFLSSSNFKIIFTTFLSLSSSSLIESFCSSVIKSLVAINLTKDSQIIITRRIQVIHSAQDSRFSVSTMCYHVNHI